MAVNMNMVNGNDTACFENADTIVLTKISKMNIKNTGVKNGLKNPIPASSRSV